MGSGQAFSATIRGVPNTSLTEINIRSGPGTNNQLVFKAAVGMSGLSILDVQPDAQATVFQGKTYQWFQLQFPNGQKGWARDDLLAISGDGTKFGYEDIPTPQFAFALTRKAIAAPTPTLPTAPQPVAPTPPSTPAPVPTAPPPAPAAPPVTPVTDIERVRLASFNITSAFEGGGYASFQNYDAGIVSYGRFQFTLATDGIFRLIDQYSRQSNSQAARELRGSYLDRARVHDGNLRNDPRFKALLLEAANDPIMQAAQDELATEKYWNVVLDLSIKPRGYQTALAHALIFDMGINFGPRHGFITSAEEESGFSPRSNVGGNLAAEQKIITRLAELRKISHDRQAERDKLPGLRVRGDFWVRLCHSGDWNLIGNDDGEMTVKPGSVVKVRNF